MDVVVLHENRGWAQNCVPIKTYVGHINFFIIIKSNNESMTCDGKVFEFYSRRKLDGQIEKADKLKNSEKKCLEMQVPKRIT
jgi:hypothetical protein